MRLAASLSGGQRIHRVEANVRETWNANSTKVSRENKTVTLKAFVPGRDLDIGKIDVDLNDVVLGLHLNDSCPWWAAQPFIDAMAGK